MKKAWTRNYVMCMALTAAIAVGAGCAKKSDQQAGGDLGISPSITAMAGNFKDIELPVEMKWATDQSMSVSTSSFQGGIVKYTGRVEMNSLKDFLISSMANNKWKLVGEAQYEKILLAFTKPSKTCMVVLEEGFGGFLGSTTATLYVTSDLASGTKMNPFGEPVK